MIAGAAASSADAHAGLVSSNPAEGATLGASPSAIELTFTERVDPKLSTITVVDRRGTVYASGAPEAVAGDPLSVSIAVRAAPKGVYTVRWHVDSAIDGHATRGTFSFGVQVPASAVGATTAPASTTPISSTLELIARWVLLLGLIALLGAAAAELGRFGDSGRGDALLAAAGWGVAALGLVLLAIAQRRSAGVSLGTLLQSPVGHALIWRAVALGAAGAALLIVLVRPGLRRFGFLLAGLATLAAIVVHVANGHAATSAWSSAITVTAQSAHFAAAGIWIGGLAALLLGLRAGAARDRAAAARDRSGAIKRFAVVAAVGLVVVTVTGILRTFSELRAFDELWSTGYGRAILVKLGLIAMIAGLAWHNVRRGVPQARRADLAPLRRTSIAELSLASVAIAVAALLGTLAPPVAGSASGLVGLSASGADVGNTVHVHLSTLSNEPGANRFVAQITDSHSGAPLRDGQVQLLFTPLDDPGVRSSSLALVRAPAGSYVGTGGNLRFDGRWAVRVLVKRPGSAVEVPLELDPIGAPQFLSVQRIPGQAPEYTKLDGNLGFVRISPHPEHAGPSAVVVTCYTVAIGAEMPIRSMVVTLAAGDAPTEQQPVRRIGPGRFVSNMRLAAGHNRIAVIAHTPFRTRLRSVFDLQVPGS